MDIVSYLAVSIVSTSYQVTGKGYHIKRQKERAQLLRYALNHIDIDRSLGLILFPGPAVFLNGFSLNDDLDDKAG